MEITDKEKVEQQETEKGTLEIMPKDITPVVKDEQQEVSLFGTKNPAKILERAVNVANILKPIIIEKQLFTTIRGKNYVHCEGWTLLGSLVGVFPRIIEVIDLSNEEIGVGRYVADCEVRTMDDRLLSQAQSECSNQEYKKNDWEHYAIRSMAETRSISKALRIPLGFIIKLAGYEPTPAEEVDEDMINITNESNKINENIVRNGKGEVDELLTDLESKFPTIEGVTVKENQVQRIYYLLRKFKVKMEVFEKEVINTDLYKLKSNMVIDVYNSVLSFCRGHGFKRVEL